MKFWRAAAAAAAEGPSGLTAVDKRVEADVSWSPALEPEPEATGRRSCSKYEWKSKGADKPCWAVGAAAVAKVFGSEKAG